MTVLLVLLTLAFFLALDFWTHRKEAPALALAAPPPEQPEGFHLEPVWVSGYQVPDGLHFHRGHVWARAVGPDTAVVGIDDFARRLIGPATGQAAAAGHLAARGQARGGSGSTDATPSGRAARGVVVETNSASSDPTSPAPIPTDGAGHSNAHRRARPPPANLSRAASRTASSRTRAKLS
jgi:glycine cleavage system H lipoate-binding protein